MFSPLLQVWSSLLLTLTPGAEASQGCAELEPVPQVLQVAWISPMSRRAASWSELHVVRVTELRSWLDQHQADQTRVLQGLGQVKSAGWKSYRHWKVTLFDVSAEELCRTVIPNAQQALPEDDPGACRMLRLPRSETGCGYTLDHHAQGEGLDSFKVQWKTAAEEGFLVMPLERFIEEN